MGPGTTLDADALTTVGNYRGNAGGGQDGELPVWSLLLLLVCLSCIFTSVIFYCTYRFERREQKYRWDHHSQNVKLGHCRTEQRLRTKDTVEDIEDPDLNAGKCSVYPTQADTVVLGGAGDISAASYGSNNNHDAKCLNASEELTSATQIPFSSSELSSPIAEKPKRSSK